MLRIPFDDLALQATQVEADVTAAVTRVVRSGRYVLTQGQEVAVFEQAFAAYCETRFAVGTSSGTAALHLALAAAGVGPGDQVLVPANTYIATAFAVSYTGATPVLVDIDPITYNMCVADAARRITARTRAILPVHLYGHPADMNGITALAQAHQLRIIEDCAQAHGATYHGRRVGSLGNAGGFSFYPTKNLGAMGDGGAVTTDDPEIALRVQQLRYMGQKVKYDHEILGYQERMDEIQAAILAIKLRHLERWNAERRQQADWYNEMLAGLPAVCPAELEGCRHVYYVYTIRSPRRDDLQQWLGDRGIATGRFYPIPLHLQPAYSHLGHRPGDFPETERAGAEILSLPLFPGYTRETIEYVADQVRAFYRQV